MEFCSRLAFLTITRTVTGASTMDAVLVTLAKVASAADHPSRRILTAVLMPLLTHIFL